MSDTQTGEAGVDAQVLPNWRTRLKALGKEAFIREEMERLGYWPPKEGWTEEAREAEAKLTLLYRELAKVREELHAIDLQLNGTHDLTRLLAEVRQKRIERVRAEHETRKQTRAQDRERKQQDDRAWRQTTLPFLGRGVSGGLRYEGGDSAKLETLSLPVLSSAAEVARAIGIEERTLAWLSYHRGATLQDHYTRFEIPKRKGGVRVISSPKQQLRIAQSWLLANILTKIEIHEAATAFRSERSIRDNAEPHVGKSVVIRIDLKDFFPSIGFRRVKGQFEAFGYNEGVATLFALLATEAPRVALTLDGQKHYVSVADRQLPQGACTSPAFTNILCRKLDARLTGAAHKLGFAYTRYADDLVFSHPNPDAPVGLLLSLVRQVVQEEGLTVNEEKTVLMRPQHRQAVTGIVVNEQPRVSREDIRRFRAFLHRCETQGLPAVSERIGKNALFYAGGYLAFLHMVNPDQEAKIRAKHPWIKGPA